jgi:hypothetical protein
MCVKEPEVSDPSNQYIDVNEISFNKDQFGHLFRKDCDNERDIIPPKPFNQKSDILIVENNKEERYFLPLPKQFRPVKSEKEKRCETQETQETEGSQAHLSTKDSHSHEIKKLDISDLKFIENYIYQRVAQDIEKVKDEYEKLALENQILKKEIVII